MAAANQSRARNRPTPESPDCRCTWLHPICVCEFIWSSVSVEVGACISPRDRANCVSYPCATPRMCNVRKYPTRRSRLEFAHKDPTGSHFVRLYVAMPLLSACQVPCECAQRILEMCRCAPRCSSELCSTPQQQKVDSQYGVLKYPTRRGRL